METYDTEPKTTDNYYKIILEKNYARDIDIFTKDKDILVMDNIFTDEECDDIINTTKNFDQSYHSNSYRHKYCINLDDLSATLYQRIGKYLPKNIYEKSDIPSIGHHDDFNHWIKTGINSNWRIVKCIPDSQLSTHLDRYYVQSVDTKSFYTIMIYLTDNIDGATYFHGKKMTIYSKKGRVLLFNQDLQHEGLVNTSDKWFARSELMFTRLESIETENDRIAMELYNQAFKIHHIDPDKAFQLEKEAFDLSKKLYDMLL